MKRISTATRVVDKFGAGKDGYTDGDVVGGVPATDLEAALFDNVQEELASVIEAAGIALNGGVLNQMLLALRAAGVFTTPAQFDATTKAATMAAVQRALGSLSGYQGFVASAALGLAEVGKLIVYSGSTAAQTLTLPPVAGVVPGAGIPFQNVATVPVTLKGNAAELIVSTGIGTGAVSANTLILGVGESTYLVFDAGGWREQQGVRNGSINFLGCSAQSWQNMSGSRTQGVTYTNSTGRPIAVAAGGTASGAAGYYTISVNGVALQQTEVVTNGRFSLFAIVPNGGTYILSKGGADTYASPLWAELR